MKYGKMTMKERKRKVREARRLLKEVDKDCTIYYGDDLRCIISALSSII